ncbi:MAG: ribonuclease E/G [Candidatus Bathyarchaeia archaeon]
MNVRGIYTTALTKLLLDHGFEIVNPSLTIKRRFGLQDNFAPPDLKIKDRYDMQGVRVLGTFEAINKFHSLLQFSFEDVITRKWLVSVDGIYKGKVVDSDEYGVYVDIGNGIVGRVPKSEIAYANEKQLTVQVERKRIGAKQPLLTTNLKIVGNYAILAQNSKVGVSLKIRDLQKRAELYALGKHLAPNGWGIIWRETSENQQREALENEIKMLAEKVEALKEKMASAEAPALLVDGLYFMDVEFPYFSKKAMDKLRASAAPTLDGHHFFKSCGGKVSSALEMAEKLLEEGEAREKVEKSFKEQILYEFPEEGSVVDIEHVKLSGIVFHLGQATVEAVNDKELKYKRTMRSNGFYDGLGIKKEAGDTALSETRLGEWHILTKYFSFDGELKGTYVNLNTPVEVYPHAIRYVDLEVDVCMKPNGLAKILDLEKLEKALERGFISKGLFETVKGKANEIASAIVFEK